MAERIREHDWSSTSIGAIESWPASLRTAVSMCLGSRHQLAIYWGPELVLLYNDAEIEPLGELHPWAFGRPAREVLAEFWDVVDPMFQRVLVHGESTWSQDQPLTFRRHGALEELYFTWSYSPIPDDAGSVGGVLLVTTETTEQVLNQRRLGLLRELAMRMLDVETADDAGRMACRTLDGVIPDVQFAAIYLADEAGVCRLAGTANISRAIAEPGPDGVRPDSVWPLAEILVTGRGLATGCIPEAGTSWSSERGPRQAFALPFTRGGRDAVAGIVVVGLDPLRPIDRAYEDFLELLAAEIGAAIADADARGAERRRSEALESLDRAKNAFFGDVSHELRTPITLILGSLDEALESAPRATTRGLIEVAARNARRLAKLVSSLIDFAQIASGGVDPAFAPTDLASATGDIASAFRSVVEHAGLRLVIDCPPLDDEVYVDREAWEKIVLNLLSNAVKFTLEGEIAVRLRRRDEVAELIVLDTGIGIAKHELPRMFERFHRVRGAQGRSHEGVGIGLALVHELVRLHGGTVEIESTLGEGTSVHVRIPFGRGHLPPRDITEAGVPSDARALSGYVEEALRWLPDRRATDRLEDGLARGAAAGAPRIVIVDDNADLRAYLARLLGSRWRVTTIADGATALAQLLQEPPDLLLLDLMMPGVDGLSLLRALRADPRTEDLPVIVLTARAGEEATVEVLEAGADDHVVKPFTGRELMARVAASIELTRLHRDAARTRAEIASAHASLDRLDRLQRVTASLAAASSPEEIARVIADDGAAALGAQGAAVAFATPEGHLEVVASRGYRATPLVEYQIRVNAPAALAEAFRTGRPIFAGDAVAVASRYAQPGAHANEGYEALIAAPLQAGRQLHGSVAFSFEAPHVFTAEAEGFVDLLAQQCGLALDRAARTRAHATELERILGELRAAQARTLAAADAERRRIERDIHDGAQQQIVAVRVKLSLAESALGANEPAQAARAHAMVLESGRELEAALHDLRRLAHGVFPRILADEGLASALAAAARQAPIPASVDADGVGRLPVEIESAVYFCCVEALQNAAKHAGGDASVQTRLSSDGSGGLTIEIRDDGVGFAAGRSAPGAGLTNMRDRIGACGGTLTVESAHAAGTTIRAWVPGAAPD